MIGRARAIELDRTYGISLLQFVERDKCKNHYCSDVLCTMEATHSLFLGAGFFSFAFLLVFDDLLDLGEDRAHHQVLHEAAVLQHCAAAFQVAALDLDGVPADAARRLLHVQVKAVDDALLSLLVIERLVGV